jgi:[ribosomal protein S5]-alanine N-acetyltransferase
MAIIEIETARIRMRPFKQEDIDDIHHLWIDPGVRKYLWDDVEITREQATSVVEGSIESFKARGFGFWVITLKGEESIIGFCGFRLFGDPPEVEILYGLFPQYWGEGLTTEAARAMIRCGFEENRFDRIFAGADPPNKVSFRVMEKTGMRFAKEIKINDLDAIYYDITREAYQPDDSVYALKRI